MLFVTRLSLEHRETILEQVFKLEVSGQGINYHQSKSGRNSIISSMKFSNLLIQIYGNIIFIVVREENIFEHYPENINELTKNSAVTLWWSWKKLSSHPTYRQWNKYNECSMSDKYLVCLVQSPPKTVGPYRVSGQLRGAMKFSRIAGIVLAPSQSLYLPNNKQTYLNLSTKESKDTLLSY